MVGFQIPLFTATLHTNSFRGRKAKPNFDSKRFGGVVLFNSGPFMGHHRISGEAENMSKSPFTPLCYFYFKSPFNNCFLKSISLGKVMSVLNTQVTITLFSLKTMPLSLEGADTVSETWQRSLNTSYQIMSLHICIIQLLQTVKVFLRLESLQITKNQFF